MSSIIKEFAKDREWAFQLTFIEAGGLDCIVCLEPIEMYNHGHERVMRCKNGHQVSVSTHHTNT